jgi:putative aldouronate transport system permease protein
MALFKKHAVMTEEEKKRYVAVQKKKGEWIKSFKTQKQVWAICLLAIIWVVTFCYIPLLGNAIAFFNYYPGMNIFECDFVGLQNFVRFFKLPEWKNVMRNTLVISGLSLTIGFITPVIFALLLNEIKSKPFKKVIQTISYMPYFVSWVVVASILLFLLGSEGSINQLLQGIGLIDKPIAFLSKGNYFWTILTTANIWKGMGWSAIIYISAIAGVDQELYQAGSVDGLGRFGKVWHITIPSILPTVVVLFILGVGGILNAGFEQQLLIGTESTRAYWEVIDTYVYRYGMQLGNYTFGTAVGLMKSIFGFSLVCFTNWLSGKVLDTRIF